MKKTKGVPFMKHRVVTVRPRRVSNLWMADDTAAYQAQRTAHLCQSIKTHL